MQMFEVNGDFVPKIVKTSGRTDGGNCITSLANAVANKNDVEYLEPLWLYKTSLKIIFGNNTSLSL